MENVENLDNLEHLENLENQENLDNMDNLENLENQENPKPLTRRGPVRPPPPPPYLSGFCGHTCICSRILWVKVLKHWPHFHRCQSLKSLLSWLVEVGLARTRWFFEPSGP
ncbi:hypothetical protein EYF80_045547 [Liparis tanakae]|uniref:Uncharacterized protein n=1 Tax=Liparis tanakae TaxID=230148 RepID=A0A4Z2FU69_9TELE|nr:hypothetical protein EYF80_045547 [Liparis tanakae]